MSEIPDVSGGETIATAWGNDVKNRTVMRYIDAAARDASVTVPTGGDLAYLQTTGLVTMYNGVAWEELNPVPTFVSLVRGLAIPQTVHTAPATQWQDIGSSLNMGEATEAVWVTVQAFTSVLQNAATPSSVYQLRCAISTDSGSSYSFGSGVWGRTDDVTRRQAISAGFFLDAGIPSGAVRVKIQGLLSTGPPITFEPSVITAQMAATAGMSN